MKDINKGNYLFLNMKTGYFKTHDNLSIRYAIIACAGSEKKGSVILLNGRAEFIEKYRETIAELNQRQFDVYIFDWRGQGLSARGLRNRYKGYVESYDDYIKDLDLFIRRIVEPGAVRPLIMLSHSLGGHVALRLLSSQTYGVSRHIMSSPMIDIQTAPWPVWAARLITCLAVKGGFGKSYAAGHSDGYLIEEKFEDNTLTSDWERFMDQRNEILKNSDLGLGGVTYAWLDATFKSIDMLLSPGYIEKIQTPSLIISAGDERVVSAAASISAAERMPDCRFVTFEGSKHEILKEADEYRALFWEEFDKFTDIKVL